MAETKNNLTRNQKLALIGLTIFGIFTLGLWGFTLNQQIKSPLAYNSANNAKQSAAIASEEEKQKTQDTDGDGLSDWDELNIYGTSPYLADSDSDGISDGVEINNGTNPNCPQGKDCSSVATVSTVGNSAVASTSNPINLNVGQTSANQTEYTSLLAGQSDAAALRKMLSDAGLDKAILDQISDEVLLKTYKDMVASSTKK